MKWSPLLYRQRMSGLMLKDHMAPLLRSCRHCCDGLRGRRAWVVFIHIATRNSGALGPKLFQSRPQPIVGVPVHPPFPGSSAGTGSTLIDLSYPLAVSLRVLGAQRVSFGIDEVWLAAATSCLRMGKLALALTDGRASPPGALRPRSRGKVAC
jgi:hypothetical protein